MNLDNLSLFVAVVQAGSFSKASEKTGVPIATLSRRINDLEKSLKIRLLNRSKQGITPTTAGQKLYENSYLAIDNLLQAQADLRQDERELQGKLRVAMPPTFVLALDWVADFQRLYPNVVVHCATSDRLVDFFGDGIDVAFRFGDLHTDNVIARKVKTVAPSFVATPDFIAKWGEPRHLSEVSNLPWATWSNGNQINYEHIFIEKIPKLNICFTSNDLQAVLYHVKQGLAVGLLPPYLVEQAIQSGELVELLPDVARRSYPIHLIYPANKYTSAVLKTFVEFCCSHL